MTFNKAFKAVVNFSTVYKAKKPGVAKQDLARKHLRESMGSEKNALSTFPGVFWYHSYLLIQILVWILVFHEKMFLSCPWEGRTSWESPWSGPQWGHTNLKPLTATAFRKKECLWSKIRRCGGSTGWKDQEMGAWTLKRTKSILCPLLL